METLRSGKTLKRRTFFETSPSSFRLITFSLSNDPKLTHLIGLVVFILGWKLWKRTVESAACRIRLKLRIVGCKITIQLGCSQVETLSFQFGCQPCTLVLGRVIRLEKNPGWKFAIASRNKNSLPRNSWRTFHSLGAYPSLVRHLLLESQQCSNQ
jgi:hypothetical protein